MSRGMNTPDLAIYLINLEDQKIHKLISDDIFVDMSKAYRSADTSYPLSALNLPKDKSVWGKVTPDYSKYKALSDKEAKTHVVCRLFGHHIIHNRPYDATSGGICNRCAYDEPDLEWDRC